MQKLWRDLDDLGQIGRNEPNLVSGYSTIWKVVKKLFTTLWIGNDVLVANHSGFIPRLKSRYLRTDNIKIHIFNSLDKPSTGFARETLVRL